MKLRQLLMLLREEYYTTLPSGFEGYTEVFVNPSLMEIREAVDSYNKVRFIALGNLEKVFIWSSESLMHIDIARSSDIIPDYYQNELYGMAELRSRRLIINDLGNLPNPDRIQELADGGFDWLKRYHFDLSDVKKKVSKVINKY